MPQATIPTTLNGDGTASAVPAVLPRKSTRTPPTPIAPADPVLSAILEAARDQSFDVGKLKALIDMRKDSERHVAQTEYNRAMALCQGELSPVARNQSNTSTNSRYADLAALAQSALPIIHRHGFGISCSEMPATKAGHIGVAVNITHVGGHCERLQFEIPVEVTGFKGTPNKTATHAYGSALTYMRRYAMLSAFNIVVAGDDDGQAAGQKRTSSAQLKRDGVWPEFEKEMRAARSLVALQNVVEQWRPRVCRWTDKWRGAAEELHSQCYERLGGTMAAFQQAAESLEERRP